MITFGTDGWRAVISDEFTFQNVQLVSEAVGHYILDRQEAGQGIVVGYDARFLSRQYAETCAAVFAAQGIKTWLSDSILPTPALTWQVVDRQAAMGVMITASHNPSEYNGYKLKAAYGGSAPLSMVADIEQYIRKQEAKPPVAWRRSVTDKVELFSPQTDYYRHVQAMLTGSILKGFRGKVIFDVMHGAAAGYVTGVAKTYGLDVIELRQARNPAFGGVHPEPIPNNLAALQQAIHDHKAVIALATDGDGDRIGAMEAEGRFINSSQIMALLMKYLVEKRGWSGQVAVTVSVSELVKRVAEKYKLALVETPIGFKYLADHLLHDDILIAGEESGGIGLKGYIPERDGILLGFLLIETVAAYNKPLGQLLDEMTETLGSFHYTRQDLRLDPAQKERLLHTLSHNPPTCFAGNEVLAANVTDGSKFYLTSGWVMFRASGTEPIVRIYAESDSAEHLAQLMTEAVRYAENA